MQLSNINSYTNVGYPNSQQIYVRVDSQSNNGCLGLGQHITLTVERIPFVSDITLHHCDENQDGQFAFDTTNLQSQILNGLTGVNVKYTTTSGVVLPSPLPNPFLTATQDIVVRVSNTTTLECYDEAIVHFVVDDLPEVFPIPTSLTSMCDDELSPQLQNGIFPFDTSTFQTTLLGGQSGMQVNYYDATNTLLPSPLPNPFHSGTQQVRVEVLNVVNNQCKAIYFIPFVVRPLPLIELVDNELICSNDLVFSKEINAGILDNSQIVNYTYQWFYNGVSITGATNYSLTVNTAGIYTVEVF